MRQRTEEPVVRKAISLCFFLLIVGMGAWIAAHVNIFGQEFVGNAVFVNDIVVQSSTTQDGAREESEDTVELQR